jgi:hypothetical protein
MNKNLKKLLVLLVAGLALVAVFFFVWQPSEEKITYAQDANFSISAVTFGNNPFTTHYDVVNNELQVTKSWFGSELTNEQEDQFLTMLVDVFDIENPDLENPSQLHYRSNIPVSVDRDEDGITLNFLNQTRRFEFVQGSSVRLRDENGFEYDLYE